LTQDARVQKRVDDVAGNVYLSLPRGKGGRAEAEGAGEAAAHHGTAVQVEPMKPALKAPVSMLLKPRYDGPLSSCAFNSNLRRYVTAYPTIIYLRDGRAVQVGPIKPRLKAPGHKRLKLRYDKTGFEFCFQVELAALHDGEMRVYSDARRALPSSP
jgi:hypothetical protein